MYCGASKRGAQRGRSPDVLLIVLLYVVYKQKCQHSHQASLEVCNSQPANQAALAVGYLPCSFALSLSLSLVRMFPASLALSHSLLSLSLCILLPGINCTLQLPLLLLLLLFMLFCLYFILYFSMRFFFLFACFLFSCALALTLAPGLCFGFSIVSGLLRKLTSCSR